MVTPSFTEEQVRSSVDLFLNASEFIHSVEEKVVVIPGSGPVSGRISLTCFYMKDGKEISAVYSLPPSLPPCSDWIAV